jgi:hypothetical protein
MGFHSRTVKTFGDGRMARKINGFFLPFPALKKSASITHEKNKLGKAKTALPGL